MSHGGFEQRVVSLAERDFIGEKEGGQYRHRVRTFVEDDITLAFARARTSLCHLVASAPGRNNSSPSDFAPSSPGWLSLYR